MIDHDDDASHAACRSQSRQGAGELLTANGDQTEIGTHLRVQLIHYRECHRNPLACERMLDYCTMRAQLRGTLSSRDKCDGMPRRGEPNAIDRTLHSRAQDNDPHADTAGVSTRHQPAELATPGARILSPHRLLTCDEIEQLGGDLLLPCAGGIQPKHLELAPDVVPRGFHRGEARGVLRSKRLSGCFGELPSPALPPRRSRPPCK